jgi:addiction module RelE/StbE family toxin
MVIHIDTTNTFEKYYKERIASNKNLREKVKQRIKIFANDPENPILKDHKLKGDKRDLRAFSVTGDIRIIYEKEKSGYVLFVDVGTHKEVY